ncbi:MAG: sigma-54 dependent transcriptional regulator [Phycisphaerales bacterium]
MKSTTHAAQVLIVEDEADHADVMAEALRKPGHVCTVVHDVAGAIEELRMGLFDVIVTDLRMPGSAGFAIDAPTLKVPPVASDGGDAGMRILDAATKLQPHAKTIMVTAHGDVARTRDAFKLGAFDFIEKPIDLDLFRTRVNNAAELVLARHENSRLQEQVEQAGFEGIIAKSEPMRKVLRQVKVVAPSNIPVLITGESGTGKEVIAASVHRNSRRGTTGGRYVTFNCAGQSESLLEDQLFGHVKGAFTGADKDRAGVFEYADGGTVFLDEIGDMPMAMQAKLLRVLESGEVIRLGSNEARHADVRFVSATNRDLKQMVAEGKFREDLFFRINGSHIFLPPLRERREDVPALALHAAKRFVGEMSPPAKGEAPLEVSITDGAMMRLTSYHWPGNVRQLLNVVQNMVVSALSEDRAKGAMVVLDLRHIPDEIRSDASDDATDIAGAAQGTLAGTSLEQIEKRAIRETLRLTAGNREQAAKLLGIGERTLYRKLKDYGLR